jgi:hypothetical protein
MQRVRQQDSFAARSNVTQFRHRVVRLGGANNVFKQHFIYIFFIYYQVVYMLYFVLFRCVTGYLFYFCS